ncbi:MAG: hypothetical protein IT161_12050 [Bryobacterales bacterium]|nr:hypothetical protein [Bryobacterales bacterium]
MRPQDAGWLVLFGGLALVSPRRGDAEIEMLAALALIQLAEGRISALNIPRGNVILIALKLVIAFLLIGVTGGVLSSYYLILIVPVVSAATTLGWAGAGVFTLLSGLAYGAFVPVAMGFGYDFPRDLLREIVLRIFLLFLVGYLTYRLAESNRTEARHAQETAEKLAQANEDLQRAEEQVRRGERLAALGQLTAGLAHELRNPMGTIKASAELLAAKVAPENEVVRELAGYVSTEVDRTNSLITRFLEFARPLKLRLQPVSVNDLIDQVVARLSRLQAERLVGVHKNFAPDIPICPLDSELMERVLANLVQNAIEASPPHSAVTIKTRSVAGAVEISIIDRGDGIDPEHRQQIFNPFFTTKPNGVGLGLAIAARIAAEHGALLTVDTELGKGSIFQLLIPASSSSGTLSSM